MTVDGGLWLAAAAYGGTDPHTVGAPVFAHTTPVYVDVDGAGRPGRVRAGACGCSTGWGWPPSRAVRPGHRERQLGDLVAVLDRARAFYRASKIFLTAIEGELLYRYSSTDQPRGDHHDCAAP